jgi:catechol 2,3-dioxygenase-like lactoylglutathione lyase family enzyme
MKLNHLALPVADIPRTLAFYTETLSIEGTARDVEDGVLFTTSDGFVLAFLEAAPTLGDGHLHFGFSRDSARTCAISARGSPTPESARATGLRWTASSR